MSAPKTRLREAIGLLRRALNDERDLSKIFARFLHAAETIPELMELSEDHEDALIVQVVKHLAAQLEGRPAEIQHGHLMRVRGSRLVHGAFATSKAAYSVVYFVGGDKGLVVAMGAGGETHYTRFTPIEVPTGGADIFPARGDGELN